MDTIGNKPKNSFDRAKAKKFFNSASIGLECSPPPNAHELKTVSWNTAVENVKKEYSQLISVNADCISVFHNTTSAVQRILTILSNKELNEKCNLLTTDSEYPGVIFAAYELWRGEVFIANIDKLIWGNKADQICDQICKSVLMVKPRVIYLSHVFRSSGYQITTNLLKLIKSIDPRLIIIIDGAQAIGNISVGKKFLDYVDFYITSAHKWLCGKTTLGLVYSNPDWATDDPAQSYSKQLISGGTGILNVLTHAVTAIKDFNGRYINTKNPPSQERMNNISKHNKELAQLFISNLDAADLDIEIIKFSTEDKIEKAIRNGIVTFRLNNEIDEDFFQVFSALEVNVSNQISEEKYKFTVLKPEIYQPLNKIQPPANRYNILFNDTEVRINEFNISERTKLPELGICRICFHYFHTKSDVDELSRFLVSQINQMYK